MTRRVVVTGVGAVSPLGVNAAEHFRRLLAGESAAVTIRHPLFEDYTQQLQAPVSGFERRKAIGNRMLRKLLSPSAGYAVGAAGEALQMAGLTGDTARLESCGLYVGSLSLEIDPETFIPPLRAALDSRGQFDMSLFAQRGMKVIDPLFLVKALPNAGAGGISVEHQVLGPNTNLTNGPTSGLNAVALAAAAIGRGETDCALGVGYDTLLGMDSFVEQFIAGRLSQRYDDASRACRPFDGERDGTVLGEGAACLVLEWEESARARGAHVLGEILGVSQTSAPALLSPANGTERGALREAACQALGMGRCGAERLGAVFVDGLGTREDDRREAGAVQEVLEGAAIPVSAATGAMGFTGAASGVFSLVHAVLALAQQVIPPLINWRVADPDCPVQIVPRATACALERALVWNSDRGIKNVAVLAGAVA